MKTIVISQNIAGTWTELIEMPTEEGITKEELEEGLEKIKDLIFDGDFINIVVEKQAVIFNKKNGPINIKLKDSDRL